MAKQIVVANHLKRLRLILQRMQFVPTNGPTDRPGTNATSTGTSVSTRNLGVQAPLAIHTTHSHLFVSVHMHTCACVHIRNYSHSQLHLYTLIHTHQQDYSLPPLLITLDSPYILYGNTLWHAHGTMSCMSIPHALIIISNRPEASSVFFAVRNPSTGTLLYG